MSDAMDIVRDRSRSPNRDYGYDRRDRDRSPGRGGRDSYRPRRGGRGDRRGGRGGRGGDFYQPRSDEARPDRRYENSIFIGNLPFETQWQELKDHFAQAGQIVRADIVSQRGRSRGMGTVEFVDRATAERAIKTFDRTEFSGREIFVREDLPPPEKAPRDSFRREGRGSFGEDRYPRERESRRERGPPLVDGYEVFVGNLPYSMRWQDLKDMFRECGDIERADVREGPGGRSKGFGTVVFRTQEAADAAIQKYDNHDLMGRRLEVRHGKFSKSAAVAAPQANIRTDGLSLNSDLTLGVTADGPPSRILFIGNLPWETAQSDLFELFGSIATVTRAELQYGRGGRPNGNAVVEAETDAFAQSIINQLNGYEYGNRSLRISYANFPSEEQLAKLRGEIEQSKVPSGPAAHAAPVVDQQMDAPSESFAAPVEAFTAPVEAVAAPVEAVSAPVEAAAPVEEVPQVEDADMIEE